VRETGADVERGVATELDAMPQALDPGLDAGLERQAASRRWRRLTEAVITRTNRPTVTGLAVLLAATGFVVARWDLWARRSIDRFILIGQYFANPARLPAGMPLRPKYGYDGQFFYRLAINPLNLSHTAYGITMDQAYRFMRIGYPVITWLASFGQRALVPYMLVAVNIAALGVLGYLGAVIARQGGRHAAWGLLLPGYFGLVTSLSRDTAEPVAAVFLVAGLLALRGRRLVLASLLLAFAALTRETAMVAVAAIFVVRLTGLLRRRTRPGREDIPWLLPTVVFVGWQAVVYAFSGAVPLFADTGRNAGTPLLAPFVAIGHNLGQLDLTGYNAADVWLAELAVLLVFAAAALRSMRTSLAPMHERVALVGFLIEICVVTPNTWNSVTADLRSFVEVYLLAVILLLSRPRGPVRSPGSWLARAAIAGLVPVLGAVIWLHLLLLA
jgi:hypothetical protein